MSIYYRFGSLDERDNIENGRGPKGKEFYSKNCNDYDASNLVDGDRVLFLFPFEDDYSMKQNYNSIMEDLKNSQEGSLDLRDLDLQYFKFSNLESKMIDEQYSGVGYYGDDYDKSEVEERAVPVDLLSEKDWQKALADGDKAKINEELPRLEDFMDNDLEQN